MANDNKSREWLYKTLNKEGYNVGKDYAEFDSLMSNNADSRKWVFDTMSGIGYNVGKDYDEFEGLVNPLNSEPTDVITSNPSSQLPQAAQPNHDAKESVNAAQGESKSSQAVQGNVAAAKPRPYKTLVDMQASDNLVDENGVSGKTQRENKAMYPFGVPGLRGQATPRAASQDYMGWQQSAKEANEKFFGGTKANDGKVLNYFQDVAPIQKRAEIADRERKAVRDAYDNENFEGFYQENVKPVFEAEKAAGEKRASANDAFRNMALRAAGNDRETALAMAAMKEVDVERETDPKKIAENTIKAVEQGRVDEYVLGRMGFDDSVLTNEQESAPLSDEEKLLFYQLYGKEIGEVTDLMVQRMYREYQEAGAPKRDLDYILGKALHDNVASTLMKALTRRMAGSSGLREQFRQQAFQQYGEDASWLTRAAGSAAPFAVDVMTGGFALPSLAGKGAVSAATGAMARRAAGRVGMEMAERAAGRYIATNSPVTNVFLRSLGGATNFGVYEAQSEIIRQFGNNEFDLGKIAQAFGHGAALGGVMGVAGGALGEATKGAGVVGKVAGNVTGVAAETGIFATDRAIEKAKEDGVSILDVDWANITGESLGMVLGMKAVGVLMSPNTLRERYSKSPDYDLKLNDADVRDLAKAGYDFRNIFKGMEEVGKIMPLRQNVEMRNYEPNNKGKSEPIEVDSKELMNILTDSSIGIDTKRKLVFLATGKIIIPEKTFGAEMEINEDGSATVYKYDIKGQVVGVTEYEDVRDAEKDLQSARSEARTNSLSLTLGTLGLEEEVREHAKKMTKAEFGISEDKLDRIFDKPEGKRTSEEQAVVRFYVSNWDGLAVKVLQSVKLKTAVEENVEEGRNMIDIEEVGAEELHETALIGRSAGEELASTPEGAAVKERIDEMFQNGASQGGLSEMLNGLSPEMADAANRYMESQAKNAGVDLQVNDNVSAAVAAERDRLAPYIQYDALDQEFVQAVEYNGQRGYITNVSEGGAEVSVLMEGESESQIILAGDSDLIISAPVLLDEYLADYEQKVAAQMTNEVENARANNPKTNTLPQVGDVISTPDGQQRVAVVTDDYRVLLEPDEYKIDENTGQQVPIHINRFSGSDLIPYEVFVGKQNEYWDAQDKLVRDEEKAVEEEAVAEQENEAPVAVEQQQTEQVAEAAPVVEDVMPMMTVRSGKKGEEREEEVPDWQSAGAERSYKYLYDEAGLERDDANAIVNNNIAQARKNLEAVQSKRPKPSTNPLTFKRELGEWNERVAQAEENVKLWNEIQNQAKRELLQQQRDEADRARTDVKVRALGDANSLENEVMRAVYELGSKDGTKLVWEDDANGTKGVGSHIGAKGSEERASRKWMLGDRKNGALYPEEFAERLVENADAGSFLSQADATDVFNILNDILRGAASRREFGEEIVNMHNANVIERQEDAYLAEREAEERQLEEDATDAFIAELAKLTPEDENAYYQSIIDEYEQGQNDATGEVAGNQAVVSQFTQYERDNAEGTIERQGGLAKNELSDSILSESWRGALHVLGRNIGRRIVILSGEDTRKRFGNGVQGFYDKSDNTLYLNEDYVKDNENLRNFVLGHEMTHILKSENPEVWNAYVGTVKSAMGDEFQKEFAKKRERYDSFIDKHNRTHEGKLRKLPDADIEEEVCSDWAGRNVLTDEESVKKIIADAEKAGADPVSLTKRILDAINQWLAQLKQALNNAVGKADEIADNIKFAEQAKKLWQDMYNVAVARQNAKMEAEQGGVKFSLEEVNQKFNEELEKLNEDNADKTILSLGNPSAILRSTGVQDKPIKLYGNKLMAKMRRHGYTKDDVKDLPKALEHPLSVFSGSQPESFAILTEMDIAGDKVLVTLSVGKGGNDIDFNIISSAYGKDFASIVRWINNGKAKYADKEKVLDYLYSSAPIAGTVSSQELESATKIIRDFVNPKLPEENFKGDGKKVSKEGENDRALIAERDKEYSEAVAAGDMEKERKLVEEAAKDAGYTIRAYHGTARKDRVGNVFRPERATSGPMAFFTDSREIAENYSHGKPDTSIGYDSDYDDYETQFRAKHKKTGKDYSIWDLWGFLPFSERAKLAEQAGHIREDWDGDGDVIYDPETKDGNGAFRNQVKDYHGNVLRALVYHWLKSGQLWKKEADFLKVLEKAGVNEALDKLGFEMPRYLDPEYREEGVYDVYLKMENPFDATEMVDEKFIQGFEEFAAEHEDEYVQESKSTDGWDKNDVTAEDFAENMRKDIEDGRTNAWTAIPDVATAYLKSLGFDGIKDKGGKYGGSVHTVYVPFSSEQVKSAALETYDDVGNLIPLSERFDSTKNDIRFSLAYEEPFYSNAMKAVENIKQEKATPEQWLKMIEKNGGLKAGEDKWLGLSDWLKSSDKKTLTKEDLLEFIGENMIQIEEVKYGGNVDDNEKMQEFRDEFDKLVSKYRNEKDNVEEEANAFNDEMYEKYGQGWANDPDRMSEEDQKRNDDITERWHRLNDGNAEAMAFSEMADNYGDDFHDAFTIDYGSGRLKAGLDWDGSLTDAARYFLDINDKPINSTRMDYTTEGLDNKREIALVVPSIESWNESDMVHFGDAGEGRAVAWVRFGETTDADGNRVLVIDEIQSKRHQEGREKVHYKQGSYEKSLEDFQSYIREMRAKYGELTPPSRWTEEEQGEFDRLRDENNRLYDVKRKGIPDAPFDKNWHELAIKRMLRLAAEEGYDKVAWTKGEQQAERYGIGGVVDKITKGKTRGENTLIELDYKNGKKDSWVVGANGKVVDGGIINANSLSELIGGELASKVMSLQEGEALNGDNLRIGGEGMKGFYDQILPRFMDKYGKKWCVKTGEVELPDIGDQTYRMNGDGKMKRGLTMWAVDVTPEMKESVMEGQPMFSLADEPLDEYDPVRRAEQIIRRTEEKDFVARQKKAVEDVGTVTHGLAEVDIPVVYVERHPFTGTGRQAIQKATNWALKNIVGKHTAHQGSVGKFTYVIDGDSIGKFLSSSSTKNSENLGIHLAVLMNLPEVIDNSIDAEVHADYTKKDGKRDSINDVKNNVLVHRLYGAVNMNGETYRVKTTIFEYDTRINKPHDYRVTKIELLKSGSSTSDALSNPIKLNGVSTISGAKLLNGVEKSYEKGKFLLDESEDLTNNAEIEPKFSLDEDESEEVLDFDNILTKATLKTAESNKENLNRKIDAIERVVQQLEEKMRKIKEGMHVSPVERGAVRTAARAQKVYDRSTVNNFVEFAKTLMDAGLFDSASVGEVKRLMNLTKGVVSKEQLEQSLNAVADLIIDHSLRESKNLLKKQLSTKGTKLDAKGVEVQGKLDIEGQRVMAALKDGMKLDKESLQTRLADAIDRMGSDNEIVANNAASEYQGLMLAKQYLEDIKDSEAEESTLKHEFQLTKDSLKEREIDRQSFKEFEESFHENIRQIKMERIKAYENLVSAVGGNIARSFEESKAFKEAEIERIKAIQNNANSDLAGKSAATQGELPWHSKLANAGLVRFFLQPVATFDEMLRFIGKKSADGRGYLWNRYMTDWTKAADNLWKSTKEAHDELDNKVKEIFAEGTFIGKDGKEHKFPKIQRWSDLFSLDRKMEGADVEYWDDGKKTYHLSEGKLLYIYMVDKMSDGKMKLRKMGITEEDVDAIKEHLNPSFIKLADWIQDEFLPKRRVKYNEVYKRMFGADMAAIDNYFPLKIDKKALHKEEDLSAYDGRSDINPATITGSVIKRTKNAAALDLMHADAFDLVLSHLDDMERWAAFAEFNRDLNTLLSYKRFRNQLQNMASGRFGAGDTFLENFKTVAAIAGGAYRPHVRKDSVDSTMVNLAKGVTAAKISMRVYTALKQLLSYPAYLSEANLIELVKSSNPVGAYQAWNWAMENLPLYAERWQSRQAGDYRLKETDMDWQVWKNNLVRTAARVGMSPNAFVDALTVAMGAKAIYETARKRYLKDGFDAETAKEKAMLDASVAYNETQQSSQSAYMSAMQLDRTAASVALTVFRNASMAYQRRMLRALSNMKNRSNPDYKVESISFMQKMLEREGLNEEEAKKASERMYRRHMWQDMVDVVVFGYILQAAWNLAPYIPYLMAGDDDDEKKKMLEDALRRAMFGGIEGLTGGSLMSEVGNLAWQIAAEDDDKKLQSLKQRARYQDFNLLPLMSDLQSVMNKSLTGDKSALVDGVYLLLQSVVGVNPQTFSDAIVATIDAFNGDFGAWKEFAFAVARIMQTPSGSMDMLYIDELGMFAHDARKLSMEDLAKRWARYKMWKDNSLLGLAYSEEKKKELEEKLIKRFENKVKERIADMDDEEVERMMIQSRPGMEQKMLEKEMEKRYQKEADELDGEELDNAYDNAVLQMERKALSKEIAKEVGASRDSYGDKPQNEYERIYQEWRTADDVREDAMLLKMQQDAENAGDESLRDKIYKERDRVNTQRQRLGKPSVGIAEGMKDVREKRTEVFENIEKWKKDREKKEKETE